MTTPTCPDCARPLDPIERRHGAVYGGRCWGCWRTWNDKRWQDAPVVWPEKPAPPDGTAPIVLPVRLGWVRCTCGERFVWDTRCTSMDRRTPEPHVHCPVCGLGWRCLGSKRSGEGEG